MRKYRKIQIAKFGFRGKIRTMVSYQKNGKKLDRIGTELGYIH